MCRTSLVAAGCVTALLVVPLATGQNPDPDLAPAPKPREVGFMPGCSGVLVALDRETITVHQRGQQPQQYKLCPVLRAGGYPKDGATSTSYRVTDLRIGDFVNLSCVRWDGEPTCLSLSIIRRPGGLVPPAPGEPPTRKYKYHERVQEDQLWEEWGIPFSTRYRGGMGDRAWTKFLEGCESGRRLPRRPYPFPPVGAFSPVFVAPLVPFAYQPGDPLPTP